MGSRALVGRLPHLAAFAVCAGVRPKGRRWCVVANVVVKHVVVVDFVCSCARCLVSACCLRGNCRALLRGYVSEGRPTNVFWVLPTT